jgi:hypothetical protein
VVRNRSDAQREHRHRGPRARRRTGGGLDNDQRIESFNEQRCDASDNGQSPAAPEPE